MFMVRIPGKRIRLLLLLKKAVVDFPEEIRPAKRVSTELCLIMRKILLQSFFQPINAYLLDINKNDWLSSVGLRMKIHRLGNLIRLDGSDIKIHRVGCQHPQWRGGFI